ncbi:MAG TPA: phosphopentomutase [Firmicutes bacterium]|nr:phosphopentomutase [Candidatus Fermentithermobacillaceae bacterium]
MPVKRVFVIVLDSVGIGALPDAHLYGDQGSNTLGNIARALGGLYLPNLAELGIGNLLDIPGVPALPPLGACGRMAMASPGKDTTTGHWEMCGIILDKPFRTYPKGFPGHIISRFEHATGRKVLGNKPASGTEIIEELGKIHMETGSPIVYTSADSVFQIACHEEIVHLSTLYSWSQTARGILVGDDLVARVIARPFLGKPGSFTRTANRKDFSLAPIRKTLLDYAANSGVFVAGVGKINDIFAGRGIHRTVHTSSNREGIEALKMLLAQTSGARHLALANLVDFDMLYGHRNNVRGYADALSEFDTALPALTSLLGPEDVLVLTADHGCDPTTPSTDHSREYVPLIIFGKPVRKGIMLETRSTFADLGATVAELLKIEYGGDGQSFCSEFLAGT